MSVRLNAFIMKCSQFLSLRFSVFAFSGGIKRDMNCGFRTAWFAWSVCRVPPATTVLRGAARPCSPAQWASSPSVDTPYTCSACWPCTTTATRYDARSAGPYGGKLRVGPPPIMWKDSRNRSISNSVPVVADVQIDIPGHEPVVVRDDTRRVKQRKE